MASSNTATVDRPDFHAGLGILWRLCRPARRPMAWSLALAIVSTFLELVPFIVIFRAVVTLAAGTATTTSLLWLAAAAAAASTARFVLWNKALAISHIAGFDVMRDLRVEVARSLTRLPLGWFTRRRSGTVQRALLEDVQRLEVLLAHSLPELVSALVYWVVAGIWLVAVDWRLGLAGLCFAPIAFSCIWIGAKDNSNHVKRVTAAGDQLQSVTAEAFRVPQLVHLFDRHGAIVRPVADAVDEAVAADAAWSREWAFLGTIYRALVTADFVVLAPFGAWMLATGRVEFAAVALALLLSAAINQPLARAYRLGFRLSWISYSGAVIEDMLRQRALPEPDRPRNPDGGRIVFDDVSFAHEPPTPTLSNVSFTAEPGTITALVGPSGGGKSTIVRLIARFWDCDTGTITVGGSPVGEMSSATLLSQMALVFQDSFVFSETVAANLRLAKPDATDDELVAACKAATIHERIMALPDGYDTTITPTGQQLSGGERQRLTIARAILRDCPIVVLDEATAMTDPDNEWEIQQAINALVVGRTVIVVAHRLRTISNCDQILVVDQGTITGTGTHDELLTSNEVYQRLWADMQLAEGLGIRQTTTAWKADRC